MDRRLPSGLLLANRVLRPLGAAFVHDEPAPPVAGPVPVTVVIPAYNRERLIARALDSVAAQRLAPAEVLVVDDASTDATVAVAEAAGARVLRSERNGGASVARRRGIEAARTEWVAMLDSDDEWPSWMLETLWPRRAAHVFVAGAAAWMRDGEAPGYEGLPVGRALRLTQPELLVWPHNLIPASGAIARRDALLRAVRRTPNYRFSEDFAIWLDLLRDGTGLVVARPTLRYMIHAGQKSASQDRYVDQHAMARAAVGNAPLGQRVLRWRQRVDAWDQSRLRPETRGPRHVLRHLAPPHGLPVVAVELLRRAQKRRGRRLTHAQDLPGTWTARGG